MENINNGYFQFNDSIFFDHGFPVVHGNYFDDNDYIDFYSRHQIGATEYIAMIYNYGISQFDSLKIFYINDDSGIDDFADNDVDGDGDSDIVFSCNNDFFWGIIYNDGTGNFSAPEYFDLSYPPLDITCADFNDDGRADVVVAGGTIEVYFSYESDFELLLLGNTLPWSSSYSLLISDFDNDNDYDIILSATSNSNHSNVYMFENLGNNQFYEHPYFEFSPFCSYSQIADFNNDSLPDMVFIESFGEGLQIFYNQDDFQLGNQQFVPVIFPSLQGLACGDLDNNEFIDITITHSLGSQEMYVKLLFNDGNGNFLDDPITSTNEISHFKEGPIISYPNPFKYETTIKFNIKEKANVELFVYDLSEKLTQVLINKNMKGGMYSVKWSGTDMTGQASSPGSYIACLKANKAVLHCFKLIKY